ncbi:MAG: aminoacyl-tRNA hydrolase, partial [bacterium]|nr:aminoacyl-tRNA hydrolase [bacterium]
QIRATHLTADSLMPTAPSHGRWLVVGLGNPGPKYEHTRHNLGTRVVEALRVSLEQPPFRAARALSARVSEGSVILAIPTTFMNDSGEAVAALVQKFRVPLDHLIVVHDDKDLAFGKLKLQRGRGAAGHRGVDSIIAVVGSNNFWRLRVGIGAPPAGVETDTYVLEPFTQAEEKKLHQDILPHALERLVSLIQTSMP